MANLIMYGLIPARFFNLYADIAGIFFAAAMSYIANTNSEALINTTNDIQSNLQS